MSVVGAPPAAAGELFGAELASAVRYAELLATAGVERGLIGPREADRLWERHLLNCAVLAEVVPPETTVVDVGSGAGLPGVPLALARPDLRVVFLEPMERRCVFLREVVAALGAESRMSVLRGRAPDVGVGKDGLRWDVAVARAVAPLERLGGMLLPVVRPGGVMLAMRGSRVDEEFAEARDGLRSQGWRDPRVLMCGADRLVEPTRVVAAERAADGAGRRGGGDRHDGRQRGQTAREQQRRTRGQACST
ncbi:16S rRNA (guanine(527)-N(7))-methyltransferase RsmG [Frankia sp. CNm7]|uniref:Ribosomal RNA small subunit methyltransferase G n=1 Tax=Frankia nepalensis TaxID=1836974 RepID=A0A937UPK9_9ACTN|nr:16S rRNA (guanine(527)-N(7))-methyltransferase RsmG [Frankia nepalensis]MBL7496746.1 16S rRNA (guanine(527)-N(7))-methyltransferase RsmG [Frankia nepalensis]MBL7510432.1 16S rRNA (guanine(527)-N(7))-methyltransferase RsmG [Frankia nepalensis]MBL7523489.1 16S rRNA (guanine(527)-N(7))-methyltransferase RsmG [Frankia nepalensis]MBL7630974.1 16S rRNA (guanine(527)-N(7))-methyltransferase RsmG [Frankia nepalensis]